MASPQDTSMQETDDRHANLLIYLSLVITGVGIGWLVGLSVSPVVSIVVTSVTGTAAAVVAAVSGLEDANDTEQPAASDQDHRPARRWRVNPVPVAMLVVGLLIGSSLGILARNESWLGSDVSGEIKKWTDAGLEADDVADRLFEIEFPSTGRQASTGTSATGSGVLGTMLFALSADECKDLTTLPPDARLIRNVRGSTNEQLQDLPDVIEDPQTLKDVLEVLCATD